MLGFLGLTRWNWSLTTFWIVITAWICALGVIYLARFKQGEWRKMRVIEPEPDSAPAAAESPLTVAG